MEERCCLLNYKVEVGDILSKLIFINKQDTCKTPDILFLLINLFLRITWRIREKQGNLCLSGAHRLVGGIRNETVLKREKYDIR